MIIVKLICLFVALWLTYVNTGKIFTKEDVTPDMILIQIIALFGFLVIQFKLYM